MELIFSLFVIPAHHYKFHRYHVLKGKKRFYVVPPTIENLTLYSNWINSSNQDNIFFGDIVGEGQCQIVDVNEGNTLIIPSGWIHSVFTPLDSLVIGGNFLHSGSIIAQLQIHYIENLSRINKKYLFPFFQHILWYALTGLLNEGREAIKIQNDLSKGTVSNLLNNYPKITWQLPYLVRTCMLIIEDKQRHLDNGKNTDWEVLECI